MLTYLGIFAGVLAAISYIPYIIDTIGRKAQPEHATWFIWLVLQTIAFFAQLSKGATSSLWFTAFDALGVVVIFLLSLKYGVGSLAKRDGIALVAAGMGLILWYFTKNALYALLITIAIDATGTSLTVIKAYKEPTTETYSMWLLVGLASLLAVVSVGTFNFALMIYPFYICLANLAVVLAKYTGEHLKPVPPIELSN